MKNAIASYKLSRSTGGTIRASIGMAIMTWISNRQ